MFNRNLIFAALVTSLIGGICYATISRFPYLALGIYGLGTYFVFSIGKLEGAAQMWDYLMEKNES